MADHYLMPDWPAPNNVKACITLRGDGASAKPYDGFNLATHVGDEESAVTQNREQLMAELGLKSVQWLEQVHGTKLVEAKTDGLVRTADGAYSCNRGHVCAVLTADCLPVLLCDRQGSQVAAVHAGWRGLADGIVGRAVKSFKAPPEDVLVYLGPAISQPNFEVGIDVLEAFYGAAINEVHLQGVTRAFQPSKQSPMKYQADIYALARAELSALGVTSISGGDQCTFADADHYYSYRRDDITGRMASLIWLN
ncbi:MAG: purine nucleoside phosphorylase YfiH [Candidatus Pelagadaptatus aseana]|uniref:peptidoglycan editing factor PgeF n=1 Tax=Candidatus Pelagadaptatus aseana TaxID=3120508 RepID=UPI0039B144BC